MGAGQGKQMSLPTPMILTRMNECMIPEERETIFDYIEMLDTKFTFPGALQRVSDEFKECDGVVTIFQILKKMIKDDICVSLVVQLFDRQRKCIPVIMDFIQFGGLDLLDRVMVEHEKNKILISEVTKLLKAVLVVGARAAISEIKNEEENLILCTTCQEACEKKRRIASKSTAKEGKIPSPKDRAKRVLTFMSNYSDKVDVLQAGLDALLNYAGNRDAKTSIGDTVLVEVISKTLKDHTDKEEIVWRACAALTMVAYYRAEIASSIAREGVHVAVAEAYKNYDNEPRVQQHILWLLDALLSYEHGTSRRRVWQSQKCLNLFEQLIAKREKLLKKSILKDKYAPYKVIIPLTVRSFMRETGGEVLPEDVPVAPQLKEFRKRRNFDDQPKFGTINDVEKDAIDGLVEEKTDPNQPRDYEAKLTYKKPKESEYSKKVKKAP
jgi:hypothetical protein